MVEENGLVLWLSASPSRAKSEDVLHVSTVSRKSKHKATMGVYRRLEGNLNATITVRQHSVLHSTIALQQSNSMRTKYNVHGEANDQLNATIRITEHDKLNARLVILAENQGNLNYEVYGKDDSDLNARAYVANASKLNVSIAIARTNRMFGNVRLIPPPRSVTTFDVIKDTSVRSDVPRINYGKSQTMYMGEQVTSYAPGVISKFESLLQFDLSKFDEFTAVDKAILELNSFSSLPALDYIASLAESEWGEYDTVWTNKPKKIGNYLGDYEISNNGYTLQLDVTEVVRHWVEYKTHENFGMVVEALGEMGQALMFLTREYGGGLGPKLTVTHYSTSTAVSAGMDYMQSRIMVRRTNTRQIRGRLRIATLRNTVNFPVHMDMVNPRYLPAQISVSHDYLRSKIRVKGYEGLNSSIKVSVDMDTTLDARIYVKGATRLRSKLYVKNAVDLQTHLKSAIGKSLDANMLISKEKMPSRIVIPHHSNIPSVIYVLAADKNDLRANAVVSKEKIPAIMHVAHKSEIDARIIVSVTKTSEIVAAMTVSREVLYTRLPIAYNDNLASRIIVNRDGESDIQAQMSMLMRKQIRGRIKTTQLDALPATIISEIERISDFNGQIKVRAGYTSKLRSRINVIQKSELDANIFVVHHGNKGINATIISEIGRISDLPTYMPIRSEEDLKANMYVVWHGNKDITARITVARREASDLQVYLPVQTGNILASNIRVLRPMWDDKRAKIIVRNEVYEELRARMKIIYESDLTSTITINSPYLPSRMSITGYGSKNLNANIDVLAQLVSEIDATLEIDNPRYLRAKIKIRSAKVAGSYAYIM